MARVKTARITRKRHKKILKQAKGYYGAKHYRFRNANQAVLKSLSYAYVGRKDRKSDFRKLWIARINAAARMNGTTYSKLIAGLKKANVTINRKMLAEVAVSDPKAFTEIAEIAKKAYCNINSTENISTVEILDYLETNISSYSISILNGKKNKKFKQSYYKEIISEVLAKGYTNPNKFAMEFFKILKEEYL